MKKCKRLIAIFLVSLILWGTFPVISTSAAQIDNFPLMNGDVLVADANTRVITRVTQDPNTRLITATAQIQNNSNSGNPLVIGAIGVAISFNEKVAPYSRNATQPAIRPPGKSTGSASRIQECSSSLASDFETFSSQFILREASSGGFIGTILSCLRATDYVRINPGQSVNMIELYFMPVNNTDLLDLDMFGFRFFYDNQAGSDSTLIRVSNYIANGTRFLEATAQNMRATDTFIVNPSAFKLHVERPRPAVSANNVTREIVGYSASDMEWSYDGITFRSGAPEVLETAHTIYVRRRGDAGYSGSDAIYGAYKMYTPSQPATVQFEVDPGGGITPTPTPPPPLLETGEHRVYITGYNDNTVRPNNPITRAETAVIFFRLLSGEEKHIPSISTFNDTVPGAWYAQAVNHLARINIITGYQDGSFRPNQPITRAEFATIASRFDKLEASQSDSFPDVAGHWARAYINSAALKGWISGYPDGTFRPQRNITRAEVVRIVNTMLNRKILPEDIPAGVIRFTDLQTHWAYTDIVEASNAHDYTRKENGYEIWTLR